MVKDVTFVRCVIIYVNSVCAKRKGDSICVYPVVDPRTPAPDPELEKERESEKAKEQAKTAEMKQEALEETVSRRRKGTGRRSLLTGSGGGVGFYNRYDHNALI